MNPIVEIDKGLELIGQEVRQMMTEYLQTSDRVTRTITAVLCILGERILNDENWITSDYFSRGGTYLFWFLISEIFTKNNKKQDTEISTIDPNIFFLSINRLGNLLATTMSDERMSLLGVFSYIAINFHGTNGTAIRNFIHNTINKNTPSPSAT